MKYIRTYGDYNSWKLDYSNPDRGFRLKPTLYKYSDVSVESKILLENDDPRKHGDSTYMEIYLDSDTEFSFYIDNKLSDAQTTITCTIDWGDGTIETKTITKDDKGFKLSHNYVANSYHIELYGVERDYSIVGNGSLPLISHPSSIKRVILGIGVVRIGGYTFYRCSSLTSINIPEGVTKIDFDAFEDCSSLTSINIPEGVTEIGGYVFRNCTSLKSIYLPEGITTINQATFYMCSSLTSINIPEGVTNIGHHAFNNCSSLTSISSLNTTAPTLGISVFASLPTNGTLHIKPGATGYDAWLSKLPSGWVIVEDL